MDRFPIGRPVGPRYEAAHFALPRLDDDDGAKNAALNEAAAKNYPTVAGLHAATDQIRNSWRSAFEFTERRMADQTLSEPDRLLRSAQHARRMREVAVDRYERAVEVAERELQDLNTKLRTYTARPGAAGDATVHSELRALIRALPDDQRAEAVSQAIKSGEWDVAKAVLSAPGTLSGLVPEAMERLRGEFLKMVDPGAHEHHFHVSKALEAAKKAFENFEDHEAKLLPWGFVADLEAGREAAE